MTKRTIVGSGPARRPLPMGREAVVRALRLCQFWQRHTTAVRRCDSTAVAPDVVSVRVNSLRYHLGMDSFYDDAPNASWLPEELREVKIDQLRSRLEAMP